MLEMNGFSNLPTDSFAGTVGIELAVTISFTIVAVLLMTTVYFEPYLEGKRHEFSISFCEKQYFYFAHEYAIRKVKSFRS